MEALCRDPAELITAFCLADVDASDFRAIGADRYSFYIAAGKVEEAKRIGNRCGVEIRQLQRRGFLHFLRRFRRRAYLLLIPLPFLLFFLRLSTCLWQIDVEGNETIRRAEILTALESLGVYPGVSGLRLDNPQIRSRMQASLGKLSWCTIQVRGSRALVVVRERRPPPKIVDDRQATEVIASKSGTIEKLNVLEGKPLIHRGDTVLRGQTLITGILSDLQEEERRVHAMGRIFAWTWYEMCFSIPLHVEEKQYTGKEKQLYSVKIGDFRLNFYNDSSISQDGYDRITTEKRAVIFGLALPVSILRTECRPYRLCAWELSEEEGVALLEERLLRALREAAPEAELLETWFWRSMEDGVLSVRMLAQCREDIAKERELDGS